MLQKSQKKLQALRALLIALGVIIALVTLTIILNANMLFPWQWGAKKNQEAALEYVSKHLPTAEIVDADYKSMVPGWMSIPMDTFYLELDGIEFTLITQS